WTKKLPRIAQAECVTRGWKSCRYLQCVMWVSCEDVVRTRVPKHANGAFDFHRTSNGGFLPGPAYRSDAYPTKANDQHEILDILDARRVRLRDPHGRDDRRCRYRLPSRTLVHRTRVPERREPRCDVSGVHRVGSQAAARHDLCRLACRIRRP